MSVLAEKEGGKATHADLAPSAAERWFNCPGSVALNRTVPQPPAKVYAVEGTVAHALLQEVMEGKLDDVGLIGRIGEVVSKDGFEIEITEEMVDAVLLFRDTVAEDKARLRDAIGQSEVRVCASSVDAGLWGTADYFVSGGGKSKLRVYDFKYGRGKIVEPDENPQMGIYGLGVVDGGKFDLEKTEVELVIVQPRGQHIDGPVRRWIVPEGWMEEFRAKAKLAVARTDEKDAALCAGDWCRWCPANLAGRCPAILKAIEVQTGVDYASVPVNPPSPQSLPSLDVMTPERLASVLDWEEAISAWFAGARERATKLLEEGKEVPGYKLVDKRTNRVWADEKKVEETYGDQVYEQKLMSPSKVEKLVGKKNFDHSLTVRPTPGKTIAKCIDPRPAASNRSAVDDYESVEVEVVDPLAPKREKIWP